MGHFDHLLKESTPALHLVEPTPLLSTPKAVRTPSQKRKTPSRKSPHPNLEPDEEEEEKGSKKRKALPSEIIILDDSDNSSDEEDLDAMKMKSYGENDNGDDTTEDPFFPSANKRILTTQASHAISQSSPVTPTISTSTPSRLPSSGRYYDQPTVHGSGSMPGCRFCAAKRGLTWTLGGENRLRCFICGGPHVSKSCPMCLCFNCWELGHRADTCSNPKLAWAPCYRCRGLHDAFFCPTLRKLQNMPQPLPQQSEAVIDLTSDEENPAPPTTSTLSDSSSSTSESSESPSLRPLQETSPAAATNVINERATIFCCQCGLRGHSSRTCQNQTMDATIAELESDPIYWLHETGRHFASLPHARELAPPARASPAPRRPQNGHRNGSDSGNGIKRSHSAAPKLQGRSREGTPKSSKSKSPSHSSFKKDKHKYPGSHTNNVAQWAQEDFEADRRQRKAQKRTAKKEAKRGGFSGRGRW